MNPTNYGFLRFDNLAGVGASTPGTPLEEAWELLGNLSPTPLAPLRSPPIIDWPRITECIRRGTQYSLTAERPELKVSLMFDSAGVGGGNYRIRGSLIKGTEQGKVSVVMPIEVEGLSDHRFSMLARYPVRYFLITNSDDRMGTQKGWRIGIASCREVIPEGEVGGANINRDFAGNG